MNTMVSELYVNSVLSVVLALIAIVPATLAAFWARKARNNSAEAKVNSSEARRNSAEAKIYSENALNEVQTNGGMTDPHPNLNDHIKYQTQMNEELIRNSETVLEIARNTQDKLDEHIRHSQTMDLALAEVYLEVRPKVKLQPPDFT